MQERVNHLLLQLCKVNREPKVVCGQMAGRKINPKTGKRDDYNPNIKTEQRIELSDGKSGSLTTVQKDNLEILISIGEH